MFEVGTVFRCRVRQGESGGGGGRVSDRQREMKDEGERAGGSGCIPVCLSTLKLSIDPIRKPTNTHTLMGVK